MIKRSDSNILLMFILIFLFNLPLFFFDRLNLSNRFFNTTPPKKQVA